jgi:hypothetical protein
MPKSPRPSAPRYAKYWVSRGFPPSRSRKTSLSSPKRASRAATDAGFSRGSLVPALAGSPGSTRNRKKLKVMTTKTVTMAHATFESR